MAAVRVPRSVNNDASQRWLTGQYPIGPLEESQVVEPPYSSASRHYRQMDRYYTTRKKRDAYSKTSSDCKRCYESLWGTAQTP